MKIPMPLINAGTNNHVSYNGDDSDGGDNEPPNLVLPKKKIPKLKQTLIVDPSLQGDYYTTEQQPQQNLKK
jgi:hypothetical protein